VEVEYCLGGEDLLAAQRFYRATHPRWWIRWSNWILWGVALVMLTGAILPTFPAVPRNRVPDILCNLLIPVLAIPLGIWLARKLLRAKRNRTASRLFEKGHWRMRIASDGMYFMTADAQSFVRWAGILRIGETPERAFFFVQENQMQVLPRHAFDSTGEFKSFIDQARRYQKESMTGQRTHDSQPASHQGDSLTTKPIQDRLP
jgi:hypothetical protein